ncbi:MAG: caspase family protein [Rubrivivax sp.]
MTKNCRWIAALIAACWVWAWTGAYAHPSTRSALIVGVSTYASPEITPLEGVPFDIISARIIARAMGIPDSRITVLRDAQATKASILAAMEQLAASVTPGSRVFVYFSGHGTRWYEPALKGCKEGLLAYDRETLTNEEIATRTRRMSEVADKVVVLFDACHSDGVSTAQRGRTRSVAGASMTPKFFLKGGQDAEACSRPVNLRTRSLLAESTKLGALEENFVQITSSRADEVSFDEAGKGGLATQGVRDCLLSKSTDRNGSGAVSIDEIQRCAQRIVEQKLKPFPDLAPHHVTISGNRNIVPVAVVRPQPPAPAVPPPPPPQETVPVATVKPPPTPMPPQAPPAPAPTVVATAPASPTATALLPPPAAPAQPVKPPPATPDSPAAPATPAAPAVNTPVAAVPTQPPAPPPVTAQPSAAPLPPPPAAPPEPPPPPALASLATLKDIEAQRNPRRKVEVSVSKPTMKIGKDALELTVRSSHDGHVYLVMLGSDAKSFYVLFPNGLDLDNKIKANQTLRLPRPDWKLMAQGPAGTNQLLVVVSDTPRDLTALKQLPPTSAAPFTFSLNDLPGREALVDFFAGRGVSGSSETFGARLLAVKEAP